MLLCILVEVNTARLSLFAVMFPPYLWLRPDKEFSSQANQETTVFVRGLSWLFYSMTICVTAGSYVIFLKYFFNGNFFGARRLHDSQGENTFF